MHLLNAGQVLDENSSWLGNILEQTGLNRRQRCGLTRHWRKHHGRTRLIGALNESHRQLRPQRHDGAAPCLTGRGIPEIVRFEVIAEIVDESLRPLVINVEIPWTHETKERCHTSIKSAHT